jgi:hypothetical protein
MTMLVVDDSNQDEVLKNHKPNMKCDWRYSLKDSVKGLVVVTALFAVLAILANLTDPYRDQINDFVSQLVVEAGFLLLASFVWLLWLLKWVCCFAIVLYVGYVIRLIVRALEKYVSS